MGKGRESDRLNGTAVTVFGFGQSVLVAPYSDSMAMALRSRGGSLAMALRYQFRFYGDVVALPVAILW